MFSIHVPDGDKRISERRLSVFEFMNSCSQEHHCKALGVVSVRARSVRLVRRRADDVHALGQEKILHRSARPIPWPGSISSSQSHHMPRAVRRESDGGGGVTPIYGVSGCCHRPLVSLFRATLRMGRWWRKFWPRKASHMTGPLARPASQPAAECKWLWVVRARVCRHTNAARRRRGPIAGSPIQQGFDRQAGPDDTPYILQRQPARRRITS
jgi:hypothetical protein